MEEADETTNTYAPGFAVGAPITGPCLCLGVEPFIGMPIVLSSAASCFGGG